MKTDPGLKLGEILKKQRDFFIRTVDGRKIITNPIAYRALEEEALRVQMKIGAQNKKKIIAECLERGIPIPNFRKESLKYGPIK